eukprot:760728-Hanusia_phi.AAC.1
MGRVRSGGGAAGNPWLRQKAHSEERADSYHHCPAALIFLTFPWQLLLQGMVSSYGMIRDLTESNFHEVVDGSSNVLVQFYAPWYRMAVIRLARLRGDVRCGHCKLIEEPYEDLAKLYQVKRAVPEQRLTVVQSVSDTIIARIDADQYRSIREYLTC